MVYAIDKAFPALIISLLLAVLGYVVAYFAIAWSRDTFLAQGLSGIDLLKVDRTKRIPTAEKIPESLGLPCAAVYLFLVLIFIPFRYFGPSHYHVTVHSVHQDLTTFLSALLSIYSGTLLGFVDDVLDIRWRYKLPIPLLSSIPMLVVYVASGGSTSVVVPAWPSFLHAFIQGASVDLGILYYAYMMLLATFCTNCVNILAGINGVEVGQAIVIALSVCANDLLYLDFGFVFRQAKDASSSSIPMHTPPEVVARHLFSLHLLLPFVGTSLALLAWNRYPSRVFVGDTYCYFAGMVLVSAGILGHYSKTLLLFFVPQIFNFLLSCPQLFGLVPCPRHRVPYVEKGKGLLVPSCVRLARHTSSWKQFLTSIILPLLQFLRLVAPVYDTEGNQVGVSNLTLLNAILVLRGARPSVIDSAIAVQPVAQNGDPALRVDGAPGTLAITERSLWYYVMMVQILGSLFAFGVRYWVASIVFPITN
ncbi:UDP-N-acetylglucosamine--dolichyl-phosphatN-acetylglucosaminephosphotransferase [Malassezia psittaci]|uniref:UDP-N-acetylglucosamine--dolichyl-phosphate N-acetylglucosaminephosphotransferase n=1 Tax=Malassezia psittaci TaxID=1821823 RepID=A0AAF0JKX8_9BASI|nr:UDP-N-acetylglucosamine--dolichyl-phosphatN-acetylglucosaminephosphotransferase [Malassezia psittaci]